MEIFVQGKSVKNTCLALSISLENSVKIENTRKALKFQFRKYCQKETTLLLKKATSFQTVKNKLKNKLKGGYTNIVLASSYMENSPDKILKNIENGIQIIDGFHL